MAKQSGDEIPNWIYKGPENGVVQPRNLRGENGRVRVSRGERGRYVLDIDGICIDVPHGLAEELCAALTSMLRPHSGLSIFERLMESLDVVVDRLMSGDGAAEDDRDPGRAEAFAMALAMIRNPYEPNYESERERAMERWDAANSRD